jgi:hypothetical protein
MSQPSKPNKTEYEDFYLTPEQERAFLPIIKQAEADLLDRKAKKQMKKPALSMAEELLQQIEDSDKK